MSVVEGAVGPGAPGEGAVTLVYDGECPACRNYVRVVRVRDAVGDFRLLDARDGGPLVEEITAAGLDLDEGMVLKIGGRLHHGEDAVHALALIGSPSGVLNRLNHRLFRSRRTSAALYPVLRAGRGLLLRLLGKRRIDNLGRADR